MRTNLKNAATLAPRRTLRILCVATLLILPSRASAGLLSHFAFDGTLTDSAGGSTGTATINGGASFVTGKIGQAISFDGVDDYVSIVAPVATPVFGTLNSFTIGMWVNTPGQTGSAERLMAVYRESENDYENGNFEVGANQTAGNRFGFESGTIISGNQFNAATPTLDGDVWRHVAVVVDQSSAVAANNFTRLYIDGVERNSVSHIGIESFNDNNRVYFGAGVAQLIDPSRFYRGLIDDVQVYDEALTGAQVASLFTNPGSTAVPEPSSLMMLFATSLFGAGIVRRRRSTRKP